MLTPFDIDPHRADDTEEAEGRDLAIFEGICAGIAITILVPLIIWVAWAVLSTRCGE